MRESSLNFYESFLVAAAAIVFVTVIIRHSFHVTVITSGG